MLTTNEFKRYNRHIILPEIGKEGQEKLKKARVLVVGAGGLGCPVLQYLTAAGIGNIGIIDFDTVDISNLQRQLLFDPSDVGKYKAEVAVEKLSRQNPLIHFTIFLERLSAGNAERIFTNFDIIIDGTDNFPTRYLVNDAAVLFGKPLIFGSIFKFEGQVSVFNYKGGPTYRCLFPEPPAAGDVPNCSEVGVLGVLPGLIGCFQANELLKIVLGIGEVLSGKLMLINALTLQNQVLSFEGNPANKTITKFADYEAFCNVAPKPMIPVGSKDSITVQELKERLDKGENLFLLDVREPFETEICTLGGLNIPMNAIPGYISSIPKDVDVIVYCHLGMRSKQIVHFLKKEHGYRNVLNLEGGIHAWATEVDATFEVY